VNNDRLVAQQTQQFIKAHTLTSASCYDNGGIHTGRVWETYRRIGVSAYRRLQSIINSVETS
jgi:hypothetical protein